MSHLSIYDTEFVDLEKLHKALIRCGIPSNQIYRMSHHIMILEGVLSNTAVVFNWGGKAFKSYYDIDNWVYKLSPESFTQKLNIEYAAVQAEEYLKDSGFRIGSYTNSNDNNIFNTVKAKTLVSTRYVF